MKWLKRAQPSAPLDAAAAQSRSGSSGEIPILRMIDVASVSWRDIAVTALPILFICAGMIGLGIWLLHPAPPSVITITTGPVGSVQNNYALHYQKVLARSGVRLIILPSGGSIDNIRRLKAKHARVDVGFVLDGVATKADEAGLVSLGTVSYQPLFVFYRSNERIANLAGLAGKRLSIGPVGSGARVLDLALLKANGILPGGSTKILSLQGEVPHRALLDGRVDAVFLMGDSAPVKVIRELLDAPGVRLLSFDEADAYVRRFPYLNKLHLPQGVFDLGRGVPARDTDLIAPAVELLARPSLNPALSDLLIETARDVHGHGNLLAPANKFPVAEAYDVPLSEDAARYYRSGKTILYRNLPFWLASLLDRILIVIVPVLVLIVPGLRFVPWMYTWRIRSRILKWYGALLSLERRVMLEDPDRLNELRQQLEEIEVAVNAMNVPLAFVDQVYVLRQHIGFVRDRLHAM